MVPVRRWFLVPLVVPLVLLLASAASADPLVGQTNLTIHHSPPGQVSSGASVTIFGKLVGRPECRANQQITLIELGVGTVGTTTTDGSGNYSFTRTVSATTSFQTSFAGSTIGTHPNERLCAASVSPVHRVKVKGAHGKSTTSVLAAEGSSAASGTALAGSDLAVVATIVVALLFLGGVALILTRRSSRGRG